MLTRTEMQTEHRHIQVPIVDDQASFRRAARSVVELTPGFELVGEAATGEASVAAAGALQPDLVLMDVHLPGINGLEASRRILGASGGQAPVIFLLSTYEASDCMEDAIECGAVAYLSKAKFGSEWLSSAWAAARGWVPNNSSGTRP